MAEPKVAGTKPVVLTLEPGPYWWCSCGMSANQPFCDGSHKGSGLKSHPFEIAEKGQVALCMCKRTGTRPFCDGSHSKLG
jgi:CDGSH iron-sulfur domain-containing protein 3